MMRTDIYPHTAVPAFMHWPIPAGEHIYAWHGGRCGLCGYRERLVMDHDHVTGIQRGLICRSCNMMESSSEHAGIIAWRSGTNTARLLGCDDIYVSAFGTTPRSLPELTPEQMARAHAAVNAIYLDTMKGLQP